MDPGLEVRWRRPDNFFALFLLCGFAVLRESLPFREERTRKSSRKAAKPHTGASDDGGRDSRAECRDAIRALDEVAEMGDEEEQSATLQALKTVIDEEPLCSRRRFR